jgi:hypothetical protein
MSYQGSAGPLGSQGPTGCQGQPGLQGPPFGPPGNGYFATTFGLSIVNSGNSTIYTPANSGSIHMTNASTDSASAFFTVGSAALGAGDIGAFWIVAINPEGSSGVRLKNNTGGTANFVYNGTVSTSIDINASSGNGYFVVWDGTNYVVL